MTASGVTDKERYLYALKHNKPLAHAVFFKHRHPLATPPFHRDMIELWHSSAPKVVTEAFRGGGKSTTMEEVAVTAACFKEFNNCLIIGASYDRAVERLSAIKNEFETNEILPGLFGPLKNQPGTGASPAAAGPWGEGKIALANGVCLQAFGHNMSLRGTKHNAVRPDFVIIDDLEDEDSVRTPEQRAKMLRWLYRTLIPALARDRPTRIRFCGNQLDADAVIVKVSRDPEWVHQKFPVMFQPPPEHPAYPQAVSDPTLPSGLWLSTWPAAFTMPQIIASRAEYARLGLLADWSCEFMCEAAPEETRTFKEADLRTAPLIRTWQAVYALYDPARSVKATSATTGRAVVSWQGPKLVVWEGGGHMWTPSEILDDIFDTDIRFAPVTIGIEETGLEEFIRQPLRLQQAARAQPLPLTALKPPRDKLSFIRSLQPYFVAKELVFAGEISPEAKAQLLGFPTGRIDFPNALAYALLIRPGQPVYEGFSHNNVVEDPPLARDEPLWLVFNATSTLTTALLVQYARDVVTIHRDWVRESPPGEAVAEIIRLAGMARAAARHRGAFDVVVPPHHFRDYDPIGLRQALARIPVQVGAVGNPENPAAGPAEVRARLAVSRPLSPGQDPVSALQVGAAARWTLNGFAAGYAYAQPSGRAGAAGSRPVGLAAGFGGPMGLQPLDNHYRPLMEALEALCASLAGPLGLPDGLGADAPRWATTPDGRRYISSRAGP